MNSRSRMLGLCIPVSLIMGGCAAPSFDQAVTLCAARYRVSDAAVRRCGGYACLRFNELTISDLEDAVGQSDEAELRRRASEVIRAATGLATTSACAEIDRLPPAGRAELAGHANAVPDVEDLKAQYHRLADQTLTQLLAEVETLPALRVREKLRDVRRHIEPAPDDRGRVWRQAPLAWGAVPAWLGINSVEHKLDEQRPAKLKKVFDRAVVWRPAVQTGGGAMGKFAPTMVIEWPDERSYPQDYDRFGSIYLTGTNDDIDVHVNTSRPMIYTYESEAKINGRRYRQLVYNWWFPHHPEMTQGDPAAGHIDGDSLRITLDSAGGPAVFEVMQSCGCGHLIFVSQRTEDAARRAFGEPQSDKQLAVERNVKGRRDLILAGTVTVSQTEAHPVVYVLAGYHEVSRIDCAAKEVLDLTTVEERQYEMTEYGVLERLPLGNGVASMFGPDGLVHKAGRAEGYLLAPTGILSAGQPRKRGTQRIRWDDYAFDDPTLLARALRLPEDF